MRIVSALWYAIAFPLYALHDLPAWARWGMGVLMLALAIVGTMMVQKELQARTLRHAGAAWEKLNVEVAKQNVDGIRQTLDKVRTLTPNDPRLNLWDEALSSGRADPNDMTMVRLVMNEHLKANRLEDAAREAKVRIAALPHDWQSRCILAHHALTRGERDEARTHLAVLPSPFEVETGVGPGPLLYALHLTRELGEPSQTMMNYLVLQILPALESTYLPHITPIEKLQMLEAYVYAFTALDTHTDLARHWVPAGTLGRALLNDAKIDVANLVRLAHIFEAQQPILRELRRRGRLSAIETDRLGVELEERIHSTWRAVNQRDPKSPPAYIGLALCCARAGQLDEARTILDRGLAECGRPVELLAALARLQQETDPSAGVEFIAGIVRERPKELPLLQILAEMAVTASRPDVVLSATAEALSLRPGLPWASRFRARALLELGRGTEAVAVLAPIRDSCLEDAEGTDLMVRSLCLAGSLPAAEAFLQKAANGPRPVATMRAGARALLQAGHADRAAYWADLLTRQQPNDRAALLLWADSLRSWAEVDGAPAWNTDRVSAAIRVYERLLEGDPGNLLLANNVAWLQLKGLRQPESALRAAAPIRAQEADAGLPTEMLETLGAIYLEVGQAERAVRLLKRATQAAPNRPGHWTHLALAYVRLGLRDDARRCLDAAAPLTKTIHEADDYVRAVRRWDS